jgi:hypothetical protein
MTTRPIANKYREGKLKRTLKRKVERGDSACLGGGAGRSRDGRRARRPHLLFSELLSNACTSPPVGRRDPLGADLRPAVEPVRTVRRTGRTRGVSRSARSTVSMWREAATQLAFDPRQARSSRRSIGPGAGPVPGRLLAAVFSNRPR